MCIGIDHWNLTAHCVYCGGPLEQVNGTRSSDTLAVSIVRCDICNREYELTARLTECRRTTRVQRRRVA